MNFQKLIGYCFLSLDKEGWRVAPGWFEPGDYLIILLKFITARSQPGASPLTV